MFHRATRLVVTLKFNKMKRVKWEIPSISRKQFEDPQGTQLGVPMFAELDSESYIAFIDYKAKMDYFRQHIWIIYDRLCEDGPSSTLYYEILSWGQTMVASNMQPSLIAMSVPFGVRREWYEHFSLIENVIYNALNAKDKNYIEWKQLCIQSNVETADKAKIAQALWKWYYSVFEPSAIRFVKLGSEHSKF